MLSSRTEPSAKSFQFIKRPLRNVVLESLTLPVPRGRSFTRSLESCLKGCGQNGIVCIPERRDTKRFSVTFLRVIFLVRNCLT
ncbi:hypothetical protein BaRGS_00014327 [Batillaria attramentaria]|uniref:Uncharacterized protein n=1 Tax=Batillaria attramentaria TaxID=370345 RepID=A0ABD0L4R8_9CAEN